MKKDKGWGIFWIYFSKGKTMDRVHCFIDRVHRLGSRVYGLHKMMVVKSRICGSYLMKRRGICGSNLNRQSRFGRWRTFD
jgi:hypothetical protein